AMGRADAAETAFRRLLALDPSVELPSGSSPKLTAPFAAAREFLAGRRIAVECRRSGAAAATLVVQSDPVDLVAGARLTSASGEPVGEDARGQARIALAIPGSAEAGGCAALDRHGNVLARAELTEAPADPGDAGTAAAESGPVVSRGPAERADRPLYARWWLYAGLGAAAGGVALYYGLELRSAQDDLEALQQEMTQADHDVTYPDFLAIKDRGDSAARNANIALVVTGVFAAVSGGLLVHQLVTDGRESDAEETPAVSAGPLPGGAAVNLTLGF
ncbi:MAG TPA: hypothetical protein VFU21_06360, partial [Kofleriaceae bacterium]|nr:hypothetical protein [Kofleriaceae bacterium]